MTEDAIEQLCLEWLRDAGWAVAHGPDLLPDQPGDRCERPDDREVFLLDRLRTQAFEINEHLPESAIEDAITRFTALAGPNLIAVNEKAHEMLVRGVEVSYEDADGAVRHDRCQLVGWDTLELNDLLAVNQVTVRRGRHVRRPDIVLFVNGIPLVVIELKNAVSATATLKKAWQQLQTYHREIPTLHQFAALEVVSDGLQARYGTLSAGLQHFSRWPTIDGRTTIEPGVPELETLVAGLLEPSRLLSIVRHFIVFEAGQGDPIKKVAKYHQVFAVDRAVERTLQAVAGDRKAGVVWHTQGAGKSLEMVFYAARMARHPDMENPTLVVLTDRQDLDGQLFSTFSNCRQLLRQDPVQAESRDDLMERLRVTGGGIVFTTIQKFFPKSRGEAYPMLSDRRNIVVIADEAHRSQYDFIDGFARHMRDALPHASFLGFTGTPIETADANTRAVFGDYVDIYDIKQAVEDGATVPISYEGRLARISLKEDQVERLDPDFEEVTEEIEGDAKEALKRKWAALEQVVGSAERIDLLARDLVEHFEHRRGVIEGKAMAVVMSRRIAVALYDAIVAIRPDWGSEQDDEGVVKVVMTGSASDPLDWQPHIRSKSRREDLAKRFKDPDSDFRLVIVRDMWLTGFDAPCLHTMYCDKPMRGHGLMQAIARVNRVFRDKPGGLVVDYIGLAESLKEAVANYTAEGGEGRPVLNVADAIAVMHEKLDILRGMMAGTDLSGWNRDAAAKLASIATGVEHVLSLEDGQKRYKQQVGDLGKAFALCAGTDEAEAARDEVGLYQAIRSGIAKLTPRSDRDPEEVDEAIRAIVQGAIQPDGIVDIFKEAGLEKPDLSILSDEFLEELKGMKRKNTAIEALRRLLEGRVAAARKTNLVQAKSFSERLQQAINSYQNRALKSAEILEELVELARAMREAAQRGNRLGLGDDEVAFYDALAENPSALQLGDDTLKQIARDLVAAVRRNVTIDWQDREPARARMRVVVKRLLKKYGYPPDAQEGAVRLVVEQASLLGDGLAA